MCLPFERLCCFCCDFCDSGCCDNEESGSVRRAAHGEKPAATTPQAPSGHGNGQPFLEGGNNGKDAAAQTTPPVETTKDAAADKTKGRAGSRKKKSREGDADVNNTTKDPLSTPTSYDSSGEKDANSNGGRHARPMPGHELQAADGNKNGGNRPAIVDNSGESNNVLYSSGGGRGRNDATENIAEPTTASQQDHVHKEPVAASPRDHGTKVFTGKMTAPQMPQMDRHGEGNDYDDPSAEASAQALTTSNVHGGRDNGHGHDNKGDRRKQRESWW